MLLDTSTTTPPTQAKICGITRADEAEAIVALGPDAIGINFWPKSKRFISLEDARPWLAGFAGLVSRIGVFVNAEADEVRRVLDSGAIDAAQLHGDEAPAFLDGLIGEGYRVFKGMGVKDAAMLERAADFPGEFILLDAHAPVDYGGTGETMDWTLGRRAVERWPERRVILAGGLNPENVGAAVRQVRPFAVDVASGVELSPGRKDLAKVADFLAAAREIG